MSQIKSTGHLRRELLMLRIRHTSHGLFVSPQMAKSVELTRLVKDRRVRIVRIRIKCDRNATESGRSFIRPGAKGTFAIPSDGQYTTGLLRCPSCSADGISYGALKHLIHCDLRTDHHLDRQRGKLDDPARTFPFRHCR